MTILKMTLSVLGPLIFLGVFSEGFNTVHHQEMTIKSNTIKDNNQAVKRVNFSHLTTHNIQSQKKG
ncbi:MAG: hypothetical protein MJK12_11520 [Colwellia sp.]|nr:hypothetical protein [Colwellia sp.]